MYNECIPILFFNKLLCENVKLPLMSYDFAVWLFGID